MGGESEMKFSDIFSGSVCVLQSKPNGSSYRQIKTFYWPDCNPVPFQVHHDSAFPEVYWLLDGH